MAEQTEINKRLQYSILEYIKSQVAGSDEDTAESLNVALDCLSSCFGLSLQDTQQAQLYSVKPATLEAIFSVGHRQVVSAIQSAKAAHVSQKTSEAAPFEKPKLSAEDQVLEQHLKSKGIFKSVEEGSKEYYEILEKAKAKLQGRTATPQAEESLEAKTKRAEDLKARGNEMINEKKFEEAVVLYTKAIELVPTHIYYGNRAAAYFQLKKYDEAIQDCKESIRLNSNYAKAYYRLGQSYSQLGKYKEALSEGFEVAALLEPNNESYQAVVEEVKQKLKPQRPAAPAGGMPDFASLLSNPAIMNMASQMMSNPAMMNQMLGMFGGAGAAPQAAAPQGPESAVPPTGDVADLLGNLAGDPSVQELRNNPRMRQIAEEVQRDGPMAALRYMNDPEVMSALGSIMNQMPGPNQGA